MTGQLWGNPLYKWDAHKVQVILVPSASRWSSPGGHCRLDHFRGLKRIGKYPLEIPPLNMVLGKRPRYRFFNVVKEKLGDLPIIAEDLGLSPWRDGHARCVQLRG